MNEAVARPPSSEDMATGRLLARLRAERKLSVGDVAQRLKYAVRQIEALEAEEFSRLPGTTFVRGMIRGYAKLLEIDPEPLLKSLESRQIPGAATVDLRAKRVPFPDGTKRRGTRVYAVLSLLVLVAVGVVVYEWYPGGLPPLPRLGQTQVAQAPAEPVAAPAPAPVEAQLPQAEAQPVQPQQPPRAQPQQPAPVQPAAEKPAAPGPGSRGQAPAPGAATAKTVAPLPKAATTISAKGPVVPGQGRIFMAFADEAWVEILDGEGQLLMAQLNQAGSSRVVTGHAPFSVVIGNAAAVRVVYNEKAVDLTPYIKIEVARFTLQ